MSSLPAVSSVPANGSPPPAAAACRRTIRVVIADDQAVVRAGFRTILESEEDIRVLAEAADGLRRWRWHAVTSPTWC